MNKVWLLGLAAASIAMISACSEDAGNNAIRELGVVAQYSSYDDLPNCTKGKEGVAAKIVEPGDDTEKKRYFVCSEGQWEHEITVSIDAYETEEDLPNCSGKTEGDIVFVEELLKKMKCEDGSWDIAKKGDSADDDEDDDYDSDNNDDNYSNDVNGNGQDNNSTDEKSSSSKKKSSSSVNNSNDDFDDFDDNSSSSKKQTVSSSSSKNITPISNIVTPTRVGPVSQYGQLLAGTNSNGKGQIYGSCKGTTSGNEVVVQGMSLFWSMASGYEGANYWTGSYVDEFVRRHNIQLIRGAMGVDEQWNGAQHYFTNGMTETYQNMMDEVVAAAIKNDIYVIIDYHSHIADNSPNNAKTFFKRMAEKWGAYDNVIFEIFNEPTTQSWSTIKNYANQVIPVIRQYSDNLIVVGNPTWSSEPNAANSNPISDANVAYTFHFYAGLDDDGSGHDVDTKGGNAVSAMNKGLSVFVTEWGNSGPSGDGAVSSSRSTTWYNWMKTHKLSGANWAVSSKPESASYFSGNASASGTWNYTTSGSWVNNNIFAYLPTSYTACGGGTTTPSSSSQSSASSGGNGNDVLGGDGMFYINRSSYGWNLYTKKSTYGYGVAGELDDAGDYVLAFWSPGSSAIDYEYDIQAKHTISLKAGYSYTLNIGLYTYNSLGPASRTVHVGLVDPDYDYYTYDEWLIDSDGDYVEYSDTYCHTDYTDSNVELYINGGIPAGGFSVRYITLEESYGCN